MRLCWRRAAAMWYRDDGVSPLGSCGNKKTPDEHDYRQQSCPRKGRTNSAAQYNVHYVQTITFLFLLSIWPQQIPTTFVHLEKKKKLCQKIIVDSSHLVWVSEYYCTITWTKAKGRVIRTVAMPTDIPFTAMTNVQKQWLEIFLKSCPALAVF